MSRVSNNASIAGTHPHGHFAQGHAESLRKAIVCGWGGVWSVFEAAVQPVCCYQEEGVPNAMSFGGLVV